MFHYNIKPNQSLRKEKNLDPFKKVNWKTYMMSKMGIIVKKMIVVTYYGKRTFIKTSKGKRGLKDFDDVVGNIQIGDLQVTDFIQRGILR